MHDATLPNIKLTLFPSTQGQEKAPAAGCDADLHTALETISVEPQLRRLSFAYSKCLLRIEGSSSSATQKCLSSMPTISPFTDSLMLLAFLGPTLTRFASFCRSRGTNGLIDVCHPSDSRRVVSFSFMACSGHHISFSLLSVRLRSEYLSLPIK